MKTYLALGSNLGNRLENLHQAVAMLDDHPQIQVLEKAGIYETEPYGDVPQDDFLNTVISVETTLSPRELLKYIHKVEKCLGRERLIHWGPRTIDIDILLMEGQILTTPELTIPHVELTKRSFVLIPLQDIYHEKLYNKPLDEWIQASGNAHEVKISQEGW